MKWTTKARIQNLVSRLPSRLSYEIYYTLQRRYGRLQQFEFKRKMRAAIETWERIRRQGRDPEGGVFFEIGTGRVPVMPLSYWLMGAERTVTIDVNPYVRIELVKECLDHIRHQTENVASLFGGLLDQNRFETLLGLAGQSTVPLDRFFDHCGIDYRAPADAAATGLADASIDFHTSYLVMEHVPPEIISKMLVEGNRIVKNDGLFVHRIDYSDHFSHRDEAITAINFLQFSDEKWRSRVHNRYMYMNRLRHDDFLGLYAGANQILLEVDPVKDARSEALLESGVFPLDPSFADKSIETLAIKNSWFVSRKKC